MLKKKKKKKKLKTVSNLVLEQFWLLWNLFYKSPSLIWGLKTFSPLNDQKFKENCCPESMIMVKYAPLVLAFAVFVDVWLLMGLHVSVEEKEEKSPHKSEQVLWCSPSIKQKPLWVENAHFLVQILVVTTLYTEKGSIVIRDEKRNFKKRSLDDKMAKKLVLFSQHFIHIHLGKITQYMPFLPKSDQDNVHLQSK